MNDFWQTCVQRLEQELPPQQISAWIRPLVPLAFDEEQAVLRVSAPNRFKLDWVRKNFSRQIEDLASNWYERPVQVAFELAASSGVAPRAPAPVAANGQTQFDASTTSRANAPSAAPGATAVSAAAAEIMHDRSRLNTDLTFD